MADAVDFVDEKNEGVENDGVLGVLPVILKYTKPPIIITTRITIIDIAAAAPDDIPVGAASGCTFGLPDGPIIAPAIRRKKSYK